MLDKITINAHSSIKINLDKIIYVDPYLIEDSLHDADIIMLTHDHYDHYDKESINKIIKPDTILVAPLVMEELLTHDYSTNKHILLNEYEEYQDALISVSAIPSYNLDKPFHPRDKHYLGYLINYQDTIIYIAGDTDATREASAVKCDIAIVPIGGTYTMNPREAALLINMIKPRVAIPSHYGSIVGKKTDAEEFVSFLTHDIECKILI